jgi:hypothetical protein
MKTAITTLTAIVAAGLVPAAAEAKAVSYKGKTRGGHTITFKRSGSKLSGVSTMIPTICVSTTRSGPGTTKAGADIYQPGGRFKLGKQVKRTIKQGSAFYSSPITKHYTFKSKAGRRGKVTGKLNVNFSYLVPDLIGYFGSYLIFICQGSTTFQATPR